MKKLSPVLLLFFLGAIVFISGCTGGLDPQALATSNSLIKQFLTEHPNAKILATHYTAEQAKNIIDQVRKDCDNPYLDEKEYYKVTINDTATNFFAVVWVDWANKTIECAYKLGTDGVVIDKPKPPGNCTAHASYKCFKDNLYWFDSCGNVQEKKEYCQSGCSGQSCVGGCKSHAKYACYGDNVYWFDNCGNVQDKKEYCNYGCENGFCKPSKANTCEQAGGYCTQIGTPVCGNGICESGEISTCAPCPANEPACQTSCTLGTCPQDCEKPVCGNGICEAGEISICSGPCPSGSTNCTSVCKLGTCPEDCVAAAITTTSASGGGGSAVTGATAATGMIISVLAETTATRTITSYQCKAGYAASPNYYCPSGGVCCIPSSPSGFCGTSTYGSCTSDDGCITGGCSGQVCQSVNEEPVITTCDLRDCYNADNYGLKCKCVRDPSVKCGTSTTEKCLTSGACQWAKTACPEDAKICPDGTSVGRTGPNCEFAPCPITTTKYYRNAYWMCYDGTEGKEGGETSCKSYADWKSYAEYSCKGKCVTLSATEATTASGGGGGGSPTTTKCGVNSFSVFNECSPGTVCTDSDGGKDYYVYGETTSYTPGVKSVYTSKDMCLQSGLNNGDLQESWCENNQVKVEIYNCPYGCKAGACVKAATCAQEGQQFSLVYKDHKDQYPEHCCSGLTEWNSGMDTSQVENGVCVQHPEIMKGSPVGTCIKCGDGVCGKSETVCNCPQDCKPPSGICQENTRCYVAEGKTITLVSSGGKKYTFGLPKVYSTTQATVTAYDGANTIYKNVTSGNIYIISGLTFYINDIFSFISHAQTNQLAFIFRSGEHSCMDSDGGSSDIAGEAKTSTSGTSDYCDFTTGSTSILMEAVCQGETPAFMKVVCQGQSPYCNHGACNASPPECRDTDQGRNPSVKGYVSESRTADGPEYGDYCENLSSKQPWDNCQGSLCGVREYYCTGYQMTYEDISCPNGCSNGACLQQPPTQTCTDTDGGYNIYQKGAVTGLDANGNMGTLTDKCWNIDGQTLFEYYCNGNYIGWNGSVLCQYGCSQGACLQSAPTCYDSNPQDDIYTKGYATIDGGVTKIYDFCGSEQGYVDNKLLFQSYCDGYRLKLKSVQCASGCSNGTCISQVQSEAMVAIGSNPKFSVSGTSYVVTDGVDIANPSTRIYLGDSLIKPGLKNNITKTYLPTLLPDGVFYDASGTTYAYSQSINIRGGTVTFGTSGGDLNPASFYLDIGASTSVPLYTESVAFNRPLNPGAIDVFGQPIDIFGKTYTFGNTGLFDSSVQRIYLYGGAASITLTEGQQSDISVSGVTHTVKLIGVSSSDVVVISVDGVTKSVTKSLYLYNIAGLDVFVPEIYTFINASHPAMAKLVLGATKITLDNGNAVRVGQSEDVIDGTLVTLTGTYGQGITKIEIAVTGKDYSSDYLVPGTAFTDPVFGTFKLAFGGLVQT